MVTRVELPANGYATAYLEVVRRYVDEVGGECSFTGGLVDDDTAFIEIVHADAVAGAVNAIIGDVVGE